MARNYKPAAFSLSPDVVDQIRTLSLELSLKHKKRISSSAIVEKALKQFLKREAAKK